MSKMHRHPSSPVLKRYSLSPAKHVQKERTEMEEDGEAKGDHTSGLQQGTCSCGKLWHTQTELTH